MFPCITINDLESFEFIAGSEQVLKFDIYDSGSSALDLTSASCSWQMAEYGQSETILTKDAVVSGSPTNRMVVTLLAADTLTFGGVYAHQPVVIEFGGSEFRPSQGKMTIIPAIS